MKPVQIQLSLTLGSDVMGTLAEIIAQAVERGTARHAQTIMEKLGQVPPQRDESSVPSVPVTSTASPSRSLAPEPKKEEPALIDVNKVAKLLNTSSRTVYRLNDMGRMPKVVRIGSLVRWNREEIGRWIADGCPPVQRRGVRRS